MKLVCSTSDLNTHLSLAQRAVPSRPTHPVLGNVLLIADEKAQKVTLRAFDLSLGIQTTFSARVPEGGTLTLPAKVLGDIVSRLSEGDIEIVGDEEEEGIVSLISASGSYQLRTMDATEFPELPEIEAAQTQNLPIEILTEGIRSTLFAASTDETKQVLTGIHLTSGPTGLEFAATDGHRLAVVSLMREAEETEEVEADSESAPHTEADESSAGSGSTPHTEADKSSAGSGSTPLELTIPARALRELDRLLATGETADGVTLSMDESQVAFELEHRRLTSRQLEGAYPTYSQLIPTTFSLSMSVDRKQLIAALERVAVLTDSKNHVVKFSLDSDKAELELSVDTIDVGRARETIPVQISGESISVAFNVKYLMDGLKALPTSEIVMQMNQPKQPVIFTPLGGIQMTYLVMPVQMRD